MLSALKFTSWICTAVYAFLAVQSLAQGESQEFRKVVATGAGLDADSALKNAFKVAVEEAVGTLVDTETIVREDDTIEEKILSASNGFIKSYDLIRQWTDGGLYRCRIEALVEIRQLKERLAAANISTLAVSGTDLAARVHTETSAAEGAAAILSKRINDIPNRVLRIQGGQPEPDLSKQQEGVTRLKIPIKIFVDQAAYNQEVAELTAALDKLALGKVTANLHLEREKRIQDGPPLLGPPNLGVQLPSGAKLTGELLATDFFYPDNPEVLKLLELIRDAQQKFSTLPEAPGVVSVMSGVSRTGGTRLSFYAVDKLALKSLDVAASCKIKATVQLLDASGNELESYELDLKPPLVFSETPLILEKGPTVGKEIGDLRIWPGLHSGSLPISTYWTGSTSWTGDVYVDIDTEKLPQLKGCKLSVSWIPEIR
jgi:hypothetical protein